MTKRLLISDMAQGRVWEAEEDLPLARYEDAKGRVFFAPEQDAVFEDMRSTLDPVVRRTPLERLAATMAPLVQQALDGYKKVGHITWPQSAQLALSEIAKRDNDPTLLDDGGVEQIIRQGKALARHIVETGENQQAARDFKRVTRQGHGH